MNDRPDFTALFRALADAEAAVLPEAMSQLPPDLRSKYDLFRKELRHMAMRAQGLQLMVTPGQPEGGQGARPTEFGNHNAAHVAAVEHAANEGEKLVGVGGL